MSIPAYNADAIIDKFNNHPEYMIPLMILAMGFGFIQYIYCFFMTRRDGESPFPIYMHAFYLAHDFLFVTLAHQWFVRYHSLPFQAVWLGMAAFNVFEVYSLYEAIKHERQETFGKYYDEPVTVRQATGWIVAMTVVSFVVLSTVRSFLSDTLMFCVFISTNVVMAIGPAMQLRARRQRVRGSVGLAFFIVVGTIATFLPQGLGMYTTADPEYFARPWFFILGAVCTMVALWHLVTVLRLPKPMPAR
ncbi:MAG: hypothetical protein PW789_17135 [Edaphobacter sp.]|uniref:hypothetical protein n=1 Tax=Edaphobacter sp. TaxID=1934404 RepID=UPI002390B43A|nr:hypothetical protein [Edaphobacter sp.]MDE1178301.1 hypothetical protein [Edaphobacter sp.]